MFTRRAHSFIVRMAVGCTAIAGRADGPGRRYRCRGARKQLLVVAFSVKGEGKFRGGSYFRSVLNLAEA